MVEHIGNEEAQYIDMEMTEALKKYKNLKDPLVKFNIAKGKVQNLPVF